ncbi:MAG: hypothetical protein LBQ98_03340 [Nitrososphaerota archaeon]|jgi:hypothetical protein|nr:hypothetical protein [Nitrososphaerota archaeon]
MKKLWILLALVVLITTQIAILSSVYPISEHGSSDESEPMTVFISKMNYASLRVNIDIVTLMDPVVLLFPNGTQIEIPTSSSYTFSVVMPHSGFSFGSYSTQSPFMNLSDDHPINVEFLSNRTFDPYWKPSSDKYVSSDSMYWFTIQGPAGIAVKGIGAGF